MPVLPADAPKELVKTFHPGQLVTVATIGGPQPAVIVSGRVSRAGNVQVVLEYPHRHRRDHGVQCRYCYGAPRPFHVDDIRRRVPGPPAKRAARVPDVDHGRSFS